MNPALDKVKDQGYEVLYCTEPLDELCMLEVKDFEGKQIADLNKENVKGIDDKAEKKQEKEKQKIEFDTVIKWLEETLGKERVSKVRLSLNHCPQNQLNTHNTK